MEGSERHASVAVLSRGEAEDLSRQRGRELGRGKEAEGGLRQTKGTRARSVQADKRGETGAGCAHWALH